MEMINSLNVTVILIWLLMSNNSVYGQNNTKDLGKPDIFLEPRFLNSVTNITVKEGELAVLPCSVQHLGTKQVAWRRLDNDHFLTIGTLTWVKDLDIQVEHHKRIGDISDWDLLIKHVRLDHDGLYECQVTSVKKVVRHIALHVQGTVVKGRQLVKEGDKIKLVCNTTGKTEIPSDVMWIKDGKEVNSSKFNHVIVTNYRSLGSKTLVSVLSIHIAKMADSGNYVCRSPLLEIDSIKVTVQRVNSTNVKREIESIHIYQPVIDNNNNNSHNSAVKNSVKHTFVLICLLCYTS